MPWSAARRSGSASSYAAAIELLRAAGADVVVEQHNAGVATWRRRSGWT